ncbi:MAG: hypothetical protein ACOYKC_09650, partial [Anaerolineaceae bacterium]
LFNIANAIDPIQFKDESLKTINSMLWNLEIYKFYWNDDVVNSRDGQKNIHIPQAHLYMVLNDGQQVTEIGSMDWR